MSNSYNIDVFEVPEQQQKKLNFCATDRQAMEQWLYDTFNQADIANISKSLYHAIEEVMCLKSKDKLRLELLDVMRPRVHELVAELEKQSALLAMQGQKRSTELGDLSQVLQRKLAHAYIVAAVTASQHMSRLFAKPIHSLSKALHIALEEMRACLLLYFQRYQAVPENMWLQIYKLYQMAQHFALESQYHPIRSAYKHLLLWGCTNSHQLHSDDIKNVDTLYSHWRSRVHLDEAGYNEYGAFFVLLDKDAAPAAQYVFEGETGAIDQSLDFSSLVSYLRQPEANTELRDLGLPERLLSMFLHTWGGTSDRTFDRKKRQGSIQVALGLSASHYFLNQRMSIEKMIDGKQAGGRDRLAKAQFDAKRPREDRLDQWDQARLNSEFRSLSQEQDGIIEFKQEQKEDAPINTVSYDYSAAKLLDMSPSGYKIECGVGDGHLLSVGNLLAVREEHHKTWDLAIIRWLKQHSEETTLIGVELYQPNITPSVIVHCNRKAEVSSNYMPAFLLPLNNADFEHEDSIIAPVNMFKPEQYFVLISADGKFFAKVNKVLGSNNYFCQFSYTECEPIKSIEEILKNDDDTSNPFISVWEIL